MQIKPLFKTGKILVTNGARELGVDLRRYLKQHVLGEWGKVDPRLEQSNDLAVELGEGPIASSYQTPSGRLVVITKPDHKATFLLVPSEIPANWGE